MPFEKFSPPRKRPNRPTVTITKNRLQLNRIWQKYFEGANFVELYIDTVNMIIGIKPQKKETSDSIKINRYDDRGIAVIAATKFLRKYRIVAEVEFDPLRDEGYLKGETSYQFMADWDEKENMVIVKLSWWNKLCGIYTNLCLGFLR